MSELKGKTVVFSGRISGHTRVSLRALLAQHSVRMVARVSSRVDYLVVGEGAAYSQLYAGHTRGTRAITIDPLAFFSMLQPQAAHTLDDLIALAVASLGGSGPEMGDMPMWWSFELALSEERAERRQNADTILANGMDSTAALKLARMAMYCALDGRHDAAQDFVVRAAACLPVVHPPMVSRIHSALAVCCHHLGQPTAPHLALAREHRNEDGRDDWPLVAALILIGQEPEADALIEASAITASTGGLYDAATTLQDLSAALPLESMLALQTRWVARKVVGEERFIPVLARWLVRAAALDRLEEVLSNVQVQWYQRMLMHEVLEAAAAAGGELAGVLHQTQDLWKEEMYRFEWLHLASQHAPALAHEALATWDGQTSAYPTKLYPLGQALRQLGVDIGCVQMQRPQQNVALLAGAGRLDEAHALLQSIAEDSGFFIDNQERYLWNLLALVGQECTPDVAEKWVQCAMDRFSMLEPDVLGELVDVLADGGAVSAAYRVWLACPHSGMREKHEEKLLLAACAAKDHTVLCRVLTRLKWHRRISRAPEVVVALSGSAGSLWQ